MSVLLKAVVPGLTALRALRLVVHALAALAAAALGYDFGIRIGAAAMAFLVAANSALFAWFMVAALFDQAERLLRRRRPPG